MTLPATSHRTVVRDAVMTALFGRVGTEGMRHQAFDVKPNFLSVEECKRFPTYCVIVTDETPGPFTLRERECQMMVTVVCYAKHDSDVRAFLDAAIEDVYDTMLLVQQTLIGVAWKLVLENVTADDAATATKPHAQAVQRWSCSHGRAIT